MFYDTLVLSGGGIKGLTMLGGLHYLHTQTKYLSHVVRYAGTSIGAVICVLLAVGYTPFEIFSHSHPFVKLLKCELSDLAALPSEWGLKSNEAFIDFVMNMIHKKISGVYTLNDLYTRTQKDVYITTVKFQVTKQEVCYLNHSTHPDLPLKLALRMSCNIPFIFTKIYYDGFYYSDGAILDNFPIKCVDDGWNKVLALYMSNRDSDERQMSFFEYYYRIMTIPARKMKYVSIDNASEMCTMFRLNDVDHNILGINVSALERKKIFDAGYDQLEFAIMSGELDDKWSEE